MSKGRTDNVESPTGNRYEWFLAKLEAELPQLRGRQRLELARSLDRLAIALNPERMYLFGSYARRTPLTGRSDIDLLVVVAESDEPTHRRAQRAYAAVRGHELPLDILVLTRDEFEEGKSSEWSVQADVARDGRLLYAA